MSAIRVDPPHRPGLKPRLERLALGRAPAHSSSHSGLSTRPSVDALLSVVVPANNEADSLPQLIDEIARALRPLSHASETVQPRMEGFEILLVDDGSTDDTRARLGALCQEYPELRPLFLAENVGQSMALAAGFHAAVGRWIATLDADLQNDPADLVALWWALPGHDAALGWRTERHDVWLKRITSRWANRVRNWALCQSIRDSGCSVRIFPRAAALRLPMFDGAHRFLGPLLLREGCRLAQVPVSHRPRCHRQSHYNLMNRSINVIIDLIGVAWLMRRPVRYRVDKATHRRPLSHVNDSRETDTECNPHMLAEPMRERHARQEA